MSSSADAHGMQKIMPWNIRAKKKNPLRVKEIINLSEGVSEDKTDKYSTWIKMKYVFNYKIKRLKWTP